MPKDLPVVPFEWTNTGPANRESGRGLADAVLEVIKAIEIRTICDLGCGNGYLAGRLAGMGYEVVGVDASESGINLADRTYPQVTFINSLINRDLARTTGLGQFDLVVSSDVIEHLYRPADLLEATLPLLRRNGQMIITTPYHGYLKNVALSLSGKMDTHFGALTDGGHIKFFSKHTLSELLTQHGFTNLKFSFYGRAPWLWKNMICQARKID
jgi:2-polyprenyl-3-methyl-5-hydroxy-6-metoxy-1,4-benzoquinol methylase